MGLFEWKEEYVTAEQVAEQKVRDKLSNVNMLNIIIDELRRAGDWVTNSKGFYDHRLRKIIITKDYLEIYDCDQHLLDFYRYVDVYTAELDNSHFQYRGRIKYADYNYKPLHAYNDGNMMYLNKVIFIWASVIQERMKKEYPDLMFNKISVDESECIAVFTYRVPDRKYCDWFE